MIGGGLTVMSSSSGGPEVSASGGGGGSPTLDFAVDWQTGTGTGSTAITDGGKLNLESGTAPGLTVVASSTISAPGDWPTNLLRIFFDGTTFNAVGFNSEGGNFGWALTPVGEYMYFRMLMYVNLDGTSDVTAEHGMQSNTSSLFQCFRLFDMTGTSDFGLGYFNTTNGDIYLIGVDGPVGVTKSAFLRIEWSLLRTGTNTYTINGIRIYDEGVSEVTPSWTASDFVDGFGAGSNSIASDNPTFTAANTNHPRGFMFGTSGAGASQNGGYVFVGGFGVRLSSSSNDWIGAYVSGEAD